MELRRIELACTKNCLLAVNFHTMCSVVLPTELRPSLAEIGYKQNDYIIVAKTSGKELGVGPTNWLSFGWTAEISDFAPTNIREFCFVLVLCFSNKNCFKCSQ